MTTQARRYTVPDDRVDPRSNGSVPVERWGQYARQVVPGITLYDTYQYLPLHRKEVVKTVQFARETVAGRPDKIMVLGSGQNSIEVSALHHAFSGSEIVAADIQEEFLETLMRRLAKEPGDTFGHTHPVVMDIAGQWPEALAADGAGAIELKDLPFVFCNIVFNWLTEEEQRACFANVSERLSPDGDFILATLTDNWNSQEVKRHIPEQMLQSPFWTILGAIGARRWADQTALQFGIHRPSVDDIYDLAARTGLNVKRVDEDRVFWRTEEGKPTAVVCHLRKGGAPKQPS